jgi:iron complex transport system ATP-binding protein
MRLDIAGVTVELGGAGILDDVRLTVAPGEFVGLVGPNGSGKTTLLRTVYRVLRPMAGRVEVGGADVWRLPAREAARRTAAVLQEGADGFDYDVGEVVALGRTPYLTGLGARARETDAAVTDALARVGMAGSEGRAFGTLSGGERQRVLVARALAQRPRVLVLDEPTNHLDIRHQLELIDLVHTLGVTTLASLHDLNLAASCDRVVVLRSGRLVATGPPADVLTRPLLADVFGVDAEPVTHPRTGRLHLLFTRSEDVHGRLPAPDLR